MYTTYIRHLIRSMKIYSLLLQDMISETDEMIEVIAEEAQDAMISLAEQNMGEEWRKGLTTIKGTLTQWQHDTQGILDAMMRSIEEDAA